MRPADFNQPIISESMHSHENVGSTICCQVGSKLSLISYVRVYNLNGVLNVVSDFVIFAIPIWPVLQLQMPLRRKAHLLVVFCLGFLCVFNEMAYTL